MITNCQYGLHVIIISTTAILKNDTLTTQFIEQVTYEIFNSLLFLSVDGTLFKSIVAVELFIITYGFINIVVCEATRSVEALTNFKCKINVISYNGF